MPPHNTTPLLRLPLLLLRARCAANGNGSAIAGGWPARGVLTSLPRPIAETPSTSPRSSSSPAAVIPPPAPSAASTVPWWWQSTIAQQQQNHHQHQRCFASSSSSGSRGGRGGGSPPRQNQSQNRPPQRDQRGQQQQQKQQQREQQQKREQQPRRNQQIRAPTLRVVLPPEVAAKHPAAAAPSAAAAAAAAADDANPNPTTRIMSRDDALALARLEGLDLVEVAANANPPVARICDWGREAFLRGASREQAERRQRVRSRLETPKELVFTPRIADHDLATKLRQMGRWMASGQRVAVVVRFRRNEEEAAEQAASYLSARLVGENPGSEAGALAKGPRNVTVVVKPPAKATAAAVAAAVGGGGGSSGGGGGGKKGKDGGGGDSEDDDGGSEEDDEDEEDDDKRPNT